jgi:outer membrane protein TolC
MRVVTTKKRLDQLEQQSEQYVNSQVQNIIASVMTNYFDVVRQQYYIRVIDQSIELAKRTLDIVKAQQSVGLANNANLYQAQLDLNNLVQAKEIQQLVIIQAKTEMLRLLTLKTDSTINIQDTILVDNSLMLDAVLGKLTNNADIIAADQQVRINELIVRETAAQRYPSVSVNGGYNYARNQNAAGQVLLNQRSGPLIGLGLSIPIYNGSIYRRQQKVAEIDVKNAELQKGLW